MQDFSAFINSQPVIRAYNFDITNYYAQNGEGKYGCLISEHLNGMKFSEINPKH